MSSEATASRPRRTILIGPSEPRGVVLGQTGGQLALIVVILALLLVALSASTSWPARVLLAALLVLLVVIGWAPVYLGWPTIHWARLWLAMRLQRATGQNIYRGG